MSTTAGTYKNQRVEQVALFLQQNYPGLSHRDGAILHAAKNQDVVDTFNSKVIETEDGCHLFVGSTYYNGYGRFGVFVEKGMASVTVRAHRFAFAIANGWLPKGRTGNTSDGMVLNHTCFERRCVNPLHLEAVPHRVNSSAMKRKPKLIVSN
jgi:hypothetical protein